MGRIEGNYLKLTRISDEKLAEYFPNLFKEGFRETSKPDPRYNCMAFAMGDERHWWESQLNGGRYRWPSDIPNNDSLSAWIAAFTSIGYEKTDDWNLDPEFKKVAIYIDFDSNTSHVAWSDGRVWKSKLGKKQDLEHVKATSLEGEQYGVVECVLKRKINHK